MNIDLFIQREADKIIETMYRRISDHPQFHDEPGPVVLAVRNQMRAEFGLPDAEVDPINTVSGRKVKHVS